jgi:hypothetical protein
MIYGAGAAIGPDGVFGVVFGNYLFVEAVVIP